MGKRSAGQAIFRPIRIPLQKSTAKQDYNNTALRAILCWHSHFR